MQPFAVTPGAVSGRGSGVRLCWGGSLSTFSIHSPTSASSVVYEPPSLPFLADSRLPAGGKGYLGLLPGAGGAQDTHRPPAPFPQGHFAPGSHGFPGSSRAPGDPKMSRVPRSSLPVGEGSAAVPCEDVAQG